MVTHSDVNPNQKLVPARHGKKDLLDNIHLGDLHNELSNVKVWIHFAHTMDFLFALR